MKLIEFEATPTTQSSSPTSPFFSLPTQTQRPHLWEGDTEPSLKMCAEVDADQLNRDLAKKWDTLELVPPAPKPFSLPRTLLTFILITVCSFSTYLLINRYVLTAVVIQGRSMTPTLQDGDHCWLNRFIYFFRAPQRGELVVLRDPGHDDLAVKRIIGMPNDTLTFEDGAIYVNGVRLSEPYVKDKSSTLLPEGKAPIVRLAADSFFVMGDNRAASEDSRFYGQIPRSAIVGMIAR